MDVQRLRWLLAALLLAPLIALASPSPAGAANSDVTGNAYTSPNFGFSLSWDDSWSVLDNSPGASRDSVVITNHHGVLDLDGFPDGSGDPKTCVDFNAALKSDAKVSNLASFDVSADSPFPDGAVTASRGFSFTFANSDGTSSDLVEAAGCRTLIPGKAVLTVLLTTRQDTYAYEAPIAQALLANLTVPSLGEAGQVFTAGVWRLSVVAAGPAAAIAPAAGLRAANGKDWLVVVADVTNWSDTDKTLPVATFALAVAQQAKPAALAQKTTLSVARRLKIGPGHAGSGEPLAAGQTERIALVFQIPQYAAGLALQFGGQTLSLAGVVDELGLRPTLPAEAGPPPLDQATVVSVVDGRTLMVMLAGGSSAVKVQLEGIDPPIKSNCYAKQSRAALKKLAGSSVQLEREGQIGAPGTLIRDVWVANADGSRTFVNGAMVASGFAGAGLAIEAGRFGSWFAGAQAAAYAKQLGLWGKCTGVHGKAAAPAAHASGGTPVAGATPMVAAGNTLFTPEWTD